MPVWRERARNQAGLWFALLGAPVAWLVHLGLSYLLVPHACAAGSAAMLHVVTVVTVVAGAGALATAWRRRGAGDAFLGLVGVAISLLFVAVTLLEGIQPVLVDPCL